EHLAAGRGLRVPGQGAPGPAGRRRASGGPAGPPGAGDRQRAPLGTGSRPARPVGAGRRRRGGQPGRGSGVPETLDDRAAQAAARLTAPGHRHAGPHTRGQGHRRPPARPAADQRDRSLRNPTADPAGHRGHPGGRRLPGPGDSPLGGGGSTGRRRRGADGVPAHQPGAGPQRRRLLADAVGVVDRLGSRARQRPAADADDQPGRLPRRDVLGGEHRLRAGSLQPDLGRADHQRRLHRRPGPGAAPAAGAPGSRRGPADGARRAGGAARRRLLGGAAAAHRGRLRLRRPRCPRRRRLRAADL
ncbi:MAG: Cell division inhibitor, partial [uncultured Friedmanniella sp.]